MYFEKFKKWIFLSPHYDDVPLIHGGMLQAFSTNNQINNHGIQIKLIFSRSNYLEGDEQGNRDTSLRREQLATGIRMVEDINCLDEMVGKSNYEYFLLRKKECVIRGKKFKEGEKFEFPQGSKETFNEEDRKIFHELIIVFQKLLLEEAAVFCPLGMKQHVDHVITRDALLEAYQLNGSKNKGNIFFGEDLPYTGLADAKDWEVLNSFLATIKTKIIDLPINSQLKAERIMKHYSSQVTPSYQAGVLGRASQLNQCERIYALLP